MLYVIAGNGTGPVKEITGALKDLRDRATKESVDFWFIIEGKDEPTATDNAIIKWAGQNEVWFEVYSTGGSTYDGAQDTIATEDVWASFLERIAERAADNEDSAVLILPVDQDGDSDEDEALMLFVEQAIDNSVEVFALNGELNKITLGEGTEDVEPEVEPEPEEAPVAVKKAAKKAAAAPAKSVAKKAGGATKKAATAAVDGEDPEPARPDDSGVVYTEEELAKMTLPELNAIARGQSLDTKGLSKRDVVNAILRAVSGEEPVAAAFAASTNGASDDVIVIVIPRSKIAALLG